MPVRSSFASAVAAAVIAVLCAISIQTVEADVAAVGNVATGHTQAVSSAEVPHTAS
jgi:hypothetical protein